MGAEKYKVMIIEDNWQEQDAFRRMAKKFPRLELVLITGRESEAEEYIVRDAVDAVILDLELEEGDGVTFLEMLKRDLLLEPFVIVTTNNESLTINNRIRDQGADFIMYKSNKAYSAEYVLDFVDKSAKYFQSAQQQREAIWKREIKQEQKKQLRRKKLEYWFAGLGIEANYKGTQYVKDVILICADKGGKASMKELYLTTARIYKTDAKNVERNIRTCIERAWNIQPPDVLEEFYQGAWDMRKGKPTNQQFILHFAVQLDDDKL